MFRSDDFDWATDGDALAEARQMVQESGYADLVTVELHSQVGPNGYPTVTFVGPHKGAVVNVIRAYFGDQASDWTLQELVDMVKRVPD